MPDTQEKLLSVEEAQEKIREEAVYTGKVDTDKTPTEQEIEQKRLDDEAEEKRLKEEAELNLTKKKKQRRKLNVNRKPRKKPKRKRIVKKKRNGWKKSG